MGLLTQHQLCFVLVTSAKLGRGRTRANSTFDQAQLLFKKADARDLLDFAHTPCSDKEVCSPVAQRSRSH